MRRIGVLQPAARRSGRSDPRQRRSGRACSNWAGPIGRNVQIDIRWARDHRRIRRLCGGIGRARAGRYPGRWQPDRWRRCNRRPAPCRSCSRLSSIRSARLRREPCAAGRQRHRLHAVRIQPEREMAGAAQADRAQRDASGRPSRSQQSCRDRPVRRHPGRGAVARVEVSPINVRDAGEIERAVTAFARSANGGLIVTGSPFAASSRSDHRAGGPAPLPAVYSDRTSSPPAA